MKTAVVVGVRGPSLDDLTGCLRGSGFKVVTEFPRGCLGPDDVVVVRPVFESAALLRGSVREVRERVGASSRILLVTSREEPTDLGPRVARAAPDLGAIEHALQADKRI